MTENRILYFDLETQKGAYDVGGWDKVHLMKMAVGVVYDSIEKKNIRYWEEDAPALIEKLLSADLVIGFNHIKFDYGVLAGYTDLDLASHVKSFDMLIDVHERLGHRLKLDSIATASLNKGKTADGLQSLKWWSEGKKELVAEYCEADVDVTRGVFEYGLKNGSLIYNSKNGSPTRLPLDWKLDELISKAGAKVKPIQHGLNF